MSTKETRSELGTQILEEAASWFAEFNEGDGDSVQRGQFNHWIRRSPEHVRAYIEIAAAWEESSGLGKSSDVEDLIARTLAETNVVPLSFAAPMPKSGLNSETGSQSSEQMPQSRAITHSSSGASIVRRRLAVAAILALAAAGLGGIAFNRNTYSTDIGEQRSIALPDGSTVALNSRSKVRIDFSDEERNVELLQGQALFQVHKDTTRPFTVHSDVTSIRAVGTQFDVYRRTGGTVITVLEGKVTVASATSSSVPGPMQRSLVTPGAGSPVPLSAGEQLTVTANVPLVPIQANVANATAWTERKLVFDNTQLSEAVEEFNRYNTRRLVIDDPSLESFHVRGTFSASDPERLAELLRQRFGVSVSETHSEIRISRRQ